MNQIGGGFVRLSASSMSRLDQGCQVSRTSTAPEMSQLRWDVLVDHVERLMRLMYFNPRTLLHVVVFLWLWKH